MAHDERQSWIRPYFPAFDGLRAIAILAVFYCHYGPMASSRLHLWGSWSGVDLFFVLSGFLITGILYDSRESAGYFRRFYLRRALRILPLPLGFFLLVLLLTPVLHLRYSPYLWTTPLFVANLLVKGAVLGNHGNPLVFTLPGLGQIELGTLWSLCVEQQFYLLWPLVIWCFPTRRALLNICGFGVLGVMALRLYLYTHSSPADRSTMYLYYSTYSRCDTLLVGAWLAVWLRKAKMTRHELQGCGTLLLVSSVFAIATLYLALDGMQAFTPGISSMQTLGYTLTAIAAAGLVLLSLDEQGRVSKVLRTPWLVRLGRISYGFYFFHDMPITILRHVAQLYLHPLHLGWLIFPVALLCTWLAAEFSYRFWESPFLRLKREIPVNHLTIPTGEQPAQQPLRRAA